MASKSIRVLIVDDNKEFCETLGDLINQTFGIFPKLAADGLEALKIMKNNPINLIITDTNMPRMNGIELLKKIRELNHDVWILVLFSGLDGSTMSVNDVRALGADFVISKHEIGSRIAAIVAKLTTPL